MTAVGQSESRKRPRLGLSQWGKKAGKEREREKAERERERKKKETEERKRKESCEERQVTVRKERQVTEGDRGKIQP